MLNLAAVSPDDVYLSSITSGCQTSLYTNYHFLETQRQDEIPLPALLQDELYSPKTVTVKRGGGIFKPVKYNKRRDVLGKPTVRSHVNPNHRNQVKRSIKFFF